MRGGRSFLILVVVALSLGAYIYFVESKRDVSDTTKKPKVFAADTDKIARIDVRSAGGDRTTITRNGTDWQITAPGTMDADTTQVSSLVSTLGSLEEDATVNANPTSVKDYGLDPPRFTVTFHVTGDPAAHQLDVGDKTPTGSDLYARIEGQPKLFLIPAYVEDSLNVTTFDLQDKSVLKFQHEAVDGLTLAAPGAPTLAFVKKGGDWLFTQPLNARADFGSVDGVVTQIANAKMQTVVVPEPGTATSGAGAPSTLSAADLKKYGFDKPQAVATVATGSSRATLEIGAKRNDQTLYARDESRPIIFTVPTSLLDSLKHKPDDLRVKDIFEFRSFTATSVDLAANGQTFTFAKEKAPAPTDPNAAAPPDVWKQTKPAARDVDQTKMTDLLTDLSNLRADSFTDKAFTSGDVLTVTARFGDTSATREEHVTFRKSGDVIQAIRPDEPGAAVVPAADFNKALGLFKDLTGGK
jgi:Domain of unknown function (DUF4340)